MMELSFMPRSCDNRAGIPITTKCNQIIRSGNKYRIVGGDHNGKSFNLGGLRYALAEPPYGKAMLVMETDDIRLTSDESD